MATILPSIHVLRACVRSRKSFHFPTLLPSLVLGVAQALGFLQHDAEISSEQGGGGGQDGITEGAQIVEPEKPGSISELGTQFQVFMGHRGTAILMLTL